jgi:hypothetical protein
VKRSEASSSCSPLINNFLTSNKAHPLGKRDASFGEKHCLGLHRSVESKELKNSLNQFEVVAGRTMTVSAGDDVATAPAGMIGGSVHAAAAATFTSNAGAPTNIKTSANLPAALQSLSERLPGRERQLRQLYALLGNVGSD